MLNLFINPRLSSQRVSLEPYVAHIGELQCVYPSKSCAVLPLTLVVNVYTHMHMRACTHTHTQKGIFSSVRSLSRVRLFVTPWTAAHQASLSITNSRSSLKLMSIESLMPYNYLILCRPLLLLPSIFPSIRVFSNESVLRIRWPKDWSFSFNISPSNEHSGLISFRINTTQQ